MKLNPELQRLLNWESLKEGTDRQKRAYRELHRLRIVELFSKEDPVVAGTIPIGIDIEGSDLDIVLQVSDFAKFKERVTHHFGHKDQFNVRERELVDRMAMVVTFISGSEQIQLFADRIPTNEQFAVRHMVQEYRLLQAGGSTLQKQILTLKTEGLKTEPAFAAVMKWKGDPYLKMLEMEQLDPAQLSALVLQTLHDIHIRPIRQEDDPALGEVIRNSFKDYEGTEQGTVFSDPVIDQLSVSFGKPRSAYFVAHRGNEILGGAGIQPLQGAPETVCELQKMYIKQSARAMRLGKALMEYCLAFASVEGFSSCYLESLPEFKDALKLYERAGFSYIPDRMGDTGYYGCSVFMTRTL